MPSLLRVLLAATALTLAVGCSGADETSADDGASSIEAFPEDPRFEGPLAVTLLPALPIMDDEDCVPDPGTQRLCSAGGQAYRILGEPRDATVLEVTASPAEDRASWTAEIRFDRSTRTAIAASRGAAAAIGGLVLVTRDGEVLAVVRPDDLTAARARFFGLEKPEAWAVPGAFGAV